MNKPNRQDSRAMQPGFRPALLSLAVALCWCVPATQAQNLPTGAQAIAGTAALSQTGKNLTVTTTNVAGGNHSAINWQSFSIGAGYGTNFIQPSAASTSINRVVTNNPSQIFGTLSSNGKLVLVNPGGITVGKGAVVDTAGFTASAVGMAEKDAKAGLLRFNDDGVTGDINVHGRIISRGGDMVLFAPNVSAGSEAVIEAPDGTVTLAAGRSAQITGAGMDAVLLEIKAPTDSALNLGTLSGNAVGIFAASLKHSGLIQATGVATNGGSISLVSRNDTLTAGDISLAGTLVATSATKGGSVSLVSSESTNVSGSIRATQTTAAGEQGGTVVVTSAKKVVIEDGASIDASGANGGGTVYVGGSWQGKDAAVLNALTTEVQKSAVINASATAQGKGGTIAVWSNGTTKTHGQLSARGAGAAGDGGRIETSGHTLVRSGLPDVSPGPGGKAGTWLIDPVDVVIQLGSAPSVSPYNGSAATTQPTIYESELEALGNTTDIEILAQRSIKAMPDTGTSSDQTLLVDGHAVKVGTTNAGPGSACVTNTACGIDLTAFTGGIQTKGGNFSAVTGLDTNTGTTALNNAGVEAAPILLPGINTSASSGRTGNGEIFLSSSGDVTVTGDLVTKATHAASGQSGGVTVDAAGTASLRNIQTQGGDFLSSDLLIVSSGPIQSLNAGQVSVTANKLVLDGDITARSGSVDSGTSGGPVTFASVSTVGELLGKGGDVYISAKGEGLSSGEASIVFAKTSNFSQIDTSSGGPNAPMSSGPGFQGGNVTIEALKGAIDTGSLGVSLVAKGGNGNAHIAHDGMSPVGQGGAGGSVTVRANDATLTGDGIRGDGLSIETYGGSGGRFNLSGQAADWGQGGRGGNVAVETAGRIALNSIYVDASGGTGSVGGDAASVRLSGQKGIAVNYTNIVASGGYGQTDLLGALAPLAQGGKGGQVDVEVGSGNLSRRDNTVSDAYLDARAQGGDVVGFLGDTAVGGDAGSIRVTGSHASQIVDEFQLALNANGGTGGSSGFSPTTRLFSGTPPLATSQGKGGSVEVEMGSITLGANSAISANGGDNPSNVSLRGEGGKVRLLALNGSISESAYAHTLGQSYPINISAGSLECSSPDACSVVMEAYSGGIHLERAGKVTAKRLSVQTTATIGSGSTFTPNSVEIARTDVGYLRGSVSGNLSLKNVNYDSDLNNASLTLGYDNGNGLMGLHVTGDADLLVSQMGEGYEAGFGALRLAEDASSNARRWNIKAGSIKMGNANSRLSASDSVNLRSGYKNFRLLGSPSTAPVTGAAFKLYQDTIAGINTPVLRLSNTENGTSTDRITFDTATGGVIDFTNSANANPAMRLVLNSSGDITQTSTSSVRVAELVAKGRRVLLENPANEIGHLSATAFGASTVAGTISVKNANAPLKLGGLRDDDLAITDGLNASGNTEVQASVSVVSLGAIELAGGITAPRISLETMGSITNAATPTNTANVNTAISNPMPLLDATSSTATNEVSIRLLADGNIGADANGSAIGVKVNSGNSVEVGQPVLGTNNHLSASLHFATGPSGMATTSQVLLSGTDRNLRLESEGAWSVNSSLAAKGIDLQANNGNVNFINGSGSLSATGHVFVDASQGAIQGDANSSTPHVQAPVAGLVARDGVSATVDAGMLFARSEGGTGATGTQDVSINNTRTDPWSLAHAFSANGNIDIKGNGLINVNGEYPFGATDQGKPLGVEGNSVSISSTNGLDIRRSIIARSGDLTLDAGSGSLEISRQPTHLSATTITPEVHLQGNNVSLRGDKVLISDTVGASVPLALNLPSGGGDDPAPAYPTAGSPLSTALGVVKIGAAGSVSIDAATGIGISGDSTVMGSMVDLHSSSGNVDLANTNAIKGTNAVFVSAEAGAIVGNYNASTAQVRSAVVGLIARDGVSAKVDAGVLFARSEGGLGAAGSQDVSIRNTHADWMLATAASAGGDVTVVGSGRMRVQGEFPFAGADQGKPLGVEGNNVTLAADGGIDVHRSVIARSGDLLLDARTSNLLIAPKATDLSTQPVPQIHIGGVNVELIGKNINITETPTTLATPFSFSASNPNSTSSPAYPALAGSIATDPGTVKIGAVSTLSLVADGAVDVSARNALQAGNMVSVEANGGSINGSNTGTAPQIKATMVALSARDAITAQIDASRLLAASEGGTGATGTQEVNISNARADWTLDAAYSAGGNVNITGAGRIRVAGESPFATTDLGAPLGVSGKAVLIAAANGLDVHRSVIARDGNLELHAGSGDLLIAPKTTLFGEQSTPQVHLGGHNVDLEGRNVVISGAPVTSSTPTGTTYTYGSSSAMAYPQLGGSIASEPGAVKVGATNALSITASSGGIFLHAGDNTPVASMHDVVAPAGSAVRLVAPSVNLNGQSLDVIGGAADDAYASIQYSVSMNLAVSGGGSAITFTPGTGSNADAVAFSTASTSTLNTGGTANMAACTTCPPTWYQGENPLNDTTTHQGLGVSTVARAPALTTQEQVAADTTSKSNVSEQSSITETLVNLTSDNQTTTTTSSTDERKEKAKESVIVVAEGNVCT